MANITITIPDAQVNRVLDAFAAHFEYERYVAGGGTMTRAQFAKYHLIQWMRGIVRMYEVQQRQAQVDASTPQVIDPDYT